MKPWLKRYELNSDKEANLELKSQKYDIQLGFETWNIQFKTLCYKNNSHSTIIYNQTQTENLKLFHIEH
jgi:hypothetical protein